jgi:TRAP transporter TAXI family solute receptor
MRENKVMRLLAFSGLIWVVLLFFLIDAADARRFHLKFGATSVRSGLYANTVAMAGIINRAYPGEIVVTVIETGGYQENVERLRRGTIHMGPASSAAGAASHLGMLDWKGRPDPNLRLLWGGYITPIHLVASRKSGITTLEGFTGQNFASNPGTTSGWHIEHFLDALGVKPKYRPMGMGASPDAMRAGVVDGWFKAGFKDAMILDLETAMEINVINLKPEHFARAEKVQPGLHLSMPIPAGLFRAVKSEQLSYAYVIADFVTKDTPEDIVYRVVKAIWENRRALVDGVSVLKEGDFDQMVTNAAKFGLKVPFHAGAVRFYREIGQKIPAELIPPEVKK